MDYRNKTFKLIGEKIKITYVDKCEDRDGKWIYGCVIRNGVNNVFISTKDEDGKDLDPEVVDLTLRHEIFHIILDRMCFHDESANESLVEWLASATRELYKQGVNV